MKNIEEIIRMIKEAFYEYGREEFERGKKVGIKEVISEIERIKIVNEKDVHERIDYPNFIINQKDWEEIKKKITSWR